jgi:arylsulfatase A-like enzyme
MSGAVCSPSRAGLLTGRYEQRFGHEQNLPPGHDGGLPLSERTIADRLRTAGLATGLVGKWHLGYPDAYHPNRRGFDWFYGLLQGSRSYLPIDRPTPHRVLQENGKALPEEGYVTDRLGRAAARFIAEHADAPFFLFVSFTAVHGPLQPRPEDLEALGQFRREQRRKYAGLMKALDDNVGLVLDALSEHGLDQHTLVVFSNDNGGQTATGAVNRPLRGRKGQLFEGGIRVPMAVRWTGTIPPGGAIDDPVIALDLLPTFCAAAGIEVDPTWRIDGIDLLPRLTGAVARLPDRALFWRSGGPQGTAAVRRGDHKLIVERGPDAVDGGAPNAQLFDLATDVGESRDLAATDPERVAALAKELAAWEADLGEPLWGLGRGR